MVQMYFSIPQNAKKIDEMHFKYSIVLKNKYLKLIKFLDFNTS